MIWRQHYPDESAARAAIVAEAMTWLGTRWAHAHDCKGGGVDCAMLLVRCFVDCKVIEPCDPRPYPSQWHMHHEAARFLQIIERCGGKSVTEAKPADLAMFKYGKHAAHGAIIVDDHHMIHASAPSRAVILDSRLAMPGRFAGYWSIF